MGCVRSLVRVQSARHNILINNRKFVVEEGTASSAVNKLLLRSTYLVSIGFVLLDVVFYAGFVQKHFFFPPVVFILLLLFLNIFIVFIKKQSLDDKFVKANLFVVAPLSLLITVASAYLEEQGGLYPNYFFQNYKYDYVALPNLTLTAILFGGFNLTRDFANHHWRKLIMLVAGLIILGAGAMFLIKPLEYQWLVAEDGPIENLTAILSLLASILSFMLIKSRHLFKNKVLRDIFGLGCLLIGFCFLVVAGEEISWGQRILRISTPEQIAAVNRQNEINLHNSETFWPFVYIGYATICSYGCSMWLLSWWGSDLFGRFSQEWKNFKKILIPQAHLFLYFSFMLLYVWLRYNHGPWKYQLWEELGELLLILGVIIHLIEVHQLLRNSDEFKNKN